MSSIYSEIEQVKQAVAQVLDDAKSLGATAAEAAMSRTRGLSVSTRLQELETIEFNQDGALGISVYVGQRKGSASTADLSPDALKQTVAKAIEIAKYTSEDPCNGIADADLLEFAPKELEMYHPWAVTPEQGIALCQQAEAAAFAHDNRIQNSDGASFSSHEGLRVYGNSHGQLVGYPSTRHSLSCVVIAEQGDEMQRDYAYTMSREQAKLWQASRVGQEAATEAVARLAARKLSTRSVPVLFRADIASSLFGHLVSAISGGSIYRKSSFLLDKVGKQVLNSGIEIVERPHIISGLASSPFDSEGVKTIDRDIISSGVLNQYLLTSYSARKLGLKSTGHAGGIHNWLVKPTHGEFNDMLKQLGTGLLVTELMGQGVNVVTGDYSRGAAGFWVENGQIQYPVSEITIAGNLKQMFMGMVAIGADIDDKGSVQCGSVLIDNMKVAGE